MKIQAKSFICEENSEKEFDLTDKKTSENAKQQISSELSEIISEIFSSDMQLYKIFFKRT